MTMTKLQNAVNELNRSELKDEIIDLIHHVLDGGDITVTYVYRNYSNEGELEWSRFTPSNHGTWYSMVALTKVTDDWFIGDMNDSEKARLAEIEEGWVMFPSLMTVLADFCDAVYSPTGDSSYLYELSERGQINFNMSALRTILECVELDTLPSNPRQAAAMGLSPEFFV